MPTYKVDWIFNQGRAGWTETWYASHTTIEDAMKVGKEGAAVRARLLGQGARLEHVRVSDVDILRDSLAEDVNVVPSNDGSIADTPWNAILCRINATELYRRQLWLRGVPDIWIDLDLGNPNANLGRVLARPQFDAFIAWLKRTPGYMLKVISKTGQGTTGPLISSLTANGLGRVVLHAAGSLANPGEQIRMSGWTGPDAALLNGVFRVVDRDAATVTIDLQFALLTDPNSNNNGKVRTRKQVYTEVTGGAILRCRKRSTGRAFFAPVGRRRRVR